MNDIFIKAYLDEDVNVLVAKLIHLHGFKASTATGAGRKGKSDAEQLEFASAQKMAILTHNRTDYEELAQEYFASDKTHHGIIIAVRRSPQEIAARLLGILNNFTADEMRNQIIYI